jgi:TonB family protein
MRSPPEPLSGSERPQETGMKKILIIDYDQSSLASLQGVFSGMGYQVVTAGDGQAGWDKYNKESPDLVLMEAMLPKVHGFELCQRITSERNSQATVFIMTGVYKDRVYRTEALRTYGASEYFEKPLKMAELVSSVEAVIGKPEPRPDPPPQAAEAAPASTVADAPRKPKTKSDDSIFALPDDLDRLSREVPKGRKPAPPRRDPAAEQRFEAIADQLLKTVLVESSTPKTVHPDPSDGNGNGNGNGNGATPDIDQFLKSALAGLDLGKEKVKAAKPAVKPAIPVQAKPDAPPVRPAVPESKLVAPPLPPAVPESKPLAPPVRPAVPESRAATGVFEKPVTPAPAADMKNTLTPGDPGSDVSPFFTPQASKPPKPVERPEKMTAPAPAAPAPRQEARRPEPPRREPDIRPTERSQAAPAASTKLAETRVLAASSIFQEAAEPEEKKGFPKVIAVVLGILAVAAVGFILLRPKRPAPAAAPPEQQQQQQQQQQEQEQPAEAVNETTAPAKPVEEPSAPVAKPAPAKQKVQPPPKPAEQAPAQAILPDQTGATAVPLPGIRPRAGTGANKTASGANTPAGNPNSPKDEGSSQPALKAEAPAQSPAAKTNAAPEPAPAAAAPAPTVSTPPSAPVQEGDLVELGAVTELPKLVKKVDPVYPIAAQRVGREGSITVNALIDEKGSVIDTAIIKGIQDDKGLGRAAEVALRKWRFQPARKDGVAVKVWKTFVIAFKADANPAGDQ